MLEHKISQKVLNIVVQECINDHHDLGLTLIYSVASSNLVSRLINLTFGRFTQVSNSGPFGCLVLFNFVQWKFTPTH